MELRSALLDFIADFANWNNSTVPEYLDTSRALTQAGKIVADEERDAAQAALDQAWEEGVPMDPASLRATLTPRRARWPSE